MRIGDHPILGRSPTKPKVIIHVDGQPLEAEEGEPIAAALIAHGFLSFRRSKTGQPRGIFCAIGQCNDCIMTVNGTPNVRTCVTPVVPGLRVDTAKPLVDPPGSEACPPVSNPVPVDP